MKQFFKFTFLKLIFAIIITVLPLIGNLLYSRSIVLENETLKIEASWGAKALYYVSNILLLPPRLITAPPWKLFRGDYFRSISGKELPLPDPFYYIDWISAFIFFLFLFIESYFLSCLISFLVNKISTRYKR